MNYTPQCNCDGKGPSVFHTASDGKIYRRKQWVGYIEEDQPVCSSCHTVYIPNQPDKE